MLQGHTLKPHVKKVQSSTTKQQNRARFCTKSAVEKPPSPQGENANAACGDCHLRTRRLKTALGKFLMPALPVEKFRKDFSEEKKWVRQNSVQKNRYIAIPGKARSQARRKSRGSIYQAPAITIRQRIARELELCRPSFDMIISQIRAIRCRYVRLALFYKDGPECVLT